LISVICPVYNEAKYIRHVIDFFLSAKPDEKELLIIDGGSTDGTPDIVKEYSAAFPNIRVLHNAYKYVPYALNMAIAQAKGDPVIRIDAHTEYAPDYFEKILEVFIETGADIVGGPMRTKGITPFQNAVAYCTSTKMGVGDSRFHDENYKGYVDSVYLGAWRKSVFPDTGVFDEQLMRNQDDEFHYRAKSKGKKIFLDPRIKLWYYPRSNTKTLFKQYFQYGLYKPLVLKKVGSEAKLRHLIPSGFVLYLLSLPIALLYWWWILPLILYVGLAAIFAVRCKGGLMTKLFCPIVYPILHIAYGTGFLLGLAKKNEPRKVFAASTLSH
jgi:succinoglycan biosynthesis protein ExoA